MAEPSNRPWKGTGPAFQRSLTFGSSSKTCQSCAPLDATLYFPHKQTLYHNLNIRNRPVVIKKVKIDIFDLAEAAISESCLLCALVYHGLLASGAPPPSLTESYIPQIWTTEGDTLYVAWASKSSSGRLEIYQERSKFQEGIPYQ
jgi:hypothetical protein